VCLHATKPSRARLEKPAAINHGHGARVFSPFGDLFPKPP
jgi:hypothetical protein